MLGAAFFFSVMSVLVKLATQRLPPQEVVLARGVISLALSWWMLRRAGIHPWGERKGFLWLRGLFGLLGLSLFYYALGNMPLPEANMLMQTNPAWTGLLAVFFLKERMSRTMIAGTTLSFGGIVLVTKPGVLFGGGEALPLLPAAAALGGAIVAAAAYVTVRHLRSSDHPLVIVFYFPLLAVPFSLAAHLFFPQVVGELVMPQGSDWLLLLGIGASTQAAQLLLTRGLAEENAGSAISIGYIQIVFAILWGVLLFREIPDALALLGAGLVIAGTFSMALKKATGRT